MTKNERLALSNFKRFKESRLYDLTDCYESFSARKYEAWEYCKNLMAEKNGWSLKIVSYNGFQFTAGFIFDEDGKRKFMYITKSVNAVCECPIEYMC